MREPTVRIDTVEEYGHEPAQTVLAVEAAGQIADPALSRLYAYWDAKRGDRRFPGRSDLDPLDIPALLSCVFLVAVHREPFDLVFRLAGTVLTDCYGGGVTGTRLADLASTGASELYREAGRTVRCGGPVLLSGPLRTRADAYRRADHLLLPLGESPHRVDMLIGGAIFRTYPLGERPVPAAGMSPWRPRIRSVDSPRREPTQRHPAVADSVPGPSAAHAIATREITGA